MTKDSIFGRQSEVCIDCFTAPSYALGLPSRSVQQSKVCRGRAQMGPDPPGKIQSIRVTFQYKTSQASKLGHNPTDSKLPFRVGWPMMARI